ncbi:MAG: glycosyltransferase family 61 protein, partial [Rhodobacteraceae bacterium]|nr:glycosyltransferase family 61 protein [Paracoccaceae bacterium]
AQHLHSFAADVPLLVDDGLAEQHYALFHWLSGGRKIIKLGFRQGAQVARLWRASAPDFWPILRQPGTVLKLKDTAVNPAIQAQLLANVPPVPADETQPKRLFIRRSGHARLADQDGMAELLAKAGFAAITPETLSLKQQLILFAGASHIAGAGGSQLLLPMMFGNPALKVLNFHNPDLEETPAIVAVAEARGQTVLVVPGEITAPNPDLPYNADFTITEPQLAAALASLGANQ